MTRPSASLPPEYFERMFQSADDPWDLETSAYEQAKYAHSIRALENRRYDSGFEVGCAKGVLTGLLAPSCRSLLAVDVSGTALRAARTRCEASDHVSFANMAFPGLAPANSFDLVVLSEVAYYWSDQDLGAAADWLLSHLVSGGDLLLVHWTGKTDYPQSGDEAVLKLRALLGDRIEVTRAERMAKYRLDLWRRQP
ncbi:SAM-dependent methyltransferase [Novosphingobium sp. ZW T3_23]|uniref:SAM-dependent methyltransferase n=1 Tax=Novosphingobium sp. ZW T3_23 TaxID=3378084 RepID=UPI003851F826